MPTFDFRVLISVLPIAITVTMVGMPVIGVLNGVIEFINKPNLDFYISTYLSLPFLIIVFVILLNNTLVDYFSVKSLIIFSLYLYVVSGVGSYYANNAVSLLFFRCLTGISAGILLPLSTSVISIFYDGEKRYRMLRYFAATSVASGILMLLLSALLSYLFSWRSIFFIYTLAIIPFATALVFFPDRELKKHMRNANSDNAKKDRARLKDVNFAAWRIIIKYFLITLISFFFLGNMGFYIKRYELGSNTLLFIAQSSYLTGSFLSTFVLIYIQRFFKIDIYFIYAMLISLGSLLIYFLPPSHLSLIAISFVIGYGYAGIGLFFNNYIIRLLPIQTRVLGVSLNYSAMFLGQFTMPFFVIYLRQLLNVETLTEVYKVMGLIGVAISFISIIDIILTKMQK